MHIINEQYDTMSSEKFDQLKLICDKCNNNECTYLCEELMNLSKEKCKPCTSLKTIVYKGANICDEDNIRDRLNYCTDNNYLCYDGNKYHLLLQTTNYTIKLLNFVYTFLNFLGISVFTLILCRFYYETKIYSMKQKKLKAEEQIIRNAQHYNSQIYELEKDKLKLKKQMIINAEKHNSQLDELEQKKLDAEKEARYNYGLYCCQLDEFSEKTVNMQQKLLSLEVASKRMHSKIDELEQEKLKAEQQLKDTRNTYCCELTELSKNNEKIQEKLLEVEVLADNLHKLAQDSEEEDNNICQLSQEDE